VGVRVAYARQGILYLAVGKLLNEVVEGAFGGGCHVQIIRELFVREHDIVDHPVQHLFIRGADGR